MGVLAIWRYPVKAMLGELLEAVEVGPGGCEGDRRWIVVDADTGERIASKRGPTDPRLRGCRAELVESCDARLPLRITLPDGQSLDGDEIEDALSELLQCRVRLERSSSAAEGRFGRTGAHHDLAPIHLITTTTLAHLHALAPECDWDARRFRPNLVVDDGARPAGFSEDALLGGCLRGPSGVELAVGLPTPRCVVPTRAQEGLPHEPGILRTIVGEHRIDLGPFGRHGCAGAYAEVARGGRLRTGDRLVVDAGDVGRDDTIGTAVARLRERLGS
jgi:uncharacterized protein YcbX